MRHRSSSEKSSLSPGDPSVDPNPQQEESEAREEIRETLSALMPWGISIVAHVGLILLAFFIVWQTIDTPVKERPVVPSLTQAPKVAPPSGEIEAPTENTPQGGAPTIPVINQVEPTVPVFPGGYEQLSQLLVGDTTGTGPGDRWGPGTESDPPTIFGGGFGDVVYLIDASGSMVDVLPFVINELKQVVNSMRPAIVNGRAIDRKATIIFFSGDGVYEVPGGGSVKGLRPMTAHFKQQVSEWVSLDNFKYETGGRGSAFVGEALARALSYKPDMIMLLSDNLTGGGQGATQHELMQDDLLALIHKNNKKTPAVRINTIQFLYEDPLVHAGLQGTLDRIAEETKGKFRFITHRDLNLR